MVTQSQIDQIQPLFSQYGIQYAGVFGSYARDEERADSDIDILVRLGEPLALPTFIRLENELAKVLKKKVDLVSEGGLKKRLRDTVLKELKPIYGQDR